VQPTPTVGEPLGATEAAELAEALEQALFAAKVCAYAQGFGVIRAASEEYGW
jgi:6-phosphogluconate dehydrogenase